MPTIRALRPVAHSSAHEERARVERRAFRGDPPRVAVHPDQLPRRHEPAGTPGRGSPSSAASGESPSMTAATAPGSASTPAASTTLSPENSASASSEAITNTAPIAVLAPDELGGRGQRRLESVRRRRESELRPQPASETPRHQRRVGHDEVREPTPIELRQRLEAPRAPPGRPARGRRRGRAAGPGPRAALHAGCHRRPASRASWAEGIGAADDAAPIPTVSTEERHGTARRPQGARLRGRERPLDRLGHRQGVPRPRRRPSASPRSRACIERRVRPLAESIGSTFVEPCDVQSGRPRSSACMDSGTRRTARSTSWCTPSPTRSARTSTGRSSTRRGTGFALALDVSAYSLVALAREAAAVPPPRVSSVMTLSYYGAEKVVDPLQRDGRREGGARGDGPLPRRGPRPRGHPRQRDLGRADPDPVRRRHRGLPQALRPVRPDRAAAGAHHDRGRRQHGGVPRLGPRGRDHGRGHLRRRRLQHPGRPLPATDRRGARPGRARRVRGRRRALARRRLGQRADPVGASRSGRWSSTYSGRSCWGSCSPGSSSGTSCRRTSARRS